MMQRDDIVNYIDNYLYIKNVSDYGPQGMQVEGSPQVSRIVLGVSAHEALFQEAIAKQAQMIIVHHGLLWDSHPRAVVGIRKNRLKVLLDHDISLLGYHLALDKHKEVGNNAQLGKALGLVPLDTPFGAHKDSAVGWLGVSNQPVSVNELAGKLKKVLGANPQVFSFGKDHIVKVGIISGGSGGTDLLSEAIEVGCDAYITGVLFEEGHALAREGKLNVLAGGHYNTEKLGVIALGKKIKEKFGVSIEFVDIPNPL